MSIKNTKDSKFHNFGNSKSTSTNSNQNQVYFIDDEEDESLEDEINSHIEVFKNGLLDKSNKIKKSPSCENGNPFTEDFDQDDVADLLKPTSEQEKHEMLYKSFKAIYNQSKNPELVKMFNVNFLI